MTAPGEVVDPVPLFTAALTAAARSHLVLNDDSRRHIRTACRQIPPRELARRVSCDIGWNRPYNARDVIAWRLAKAAGEQPDNDEGDAR